MQRRSQSRKEKEISMSVRRALLSAAVLIFSTNAFAQQAGTPEEQAACRPDVRRFCSRIGQNEGPNVFLECLQQHRDRLSVRCRAVLDSHGV
jgi:hypothetical protein